MNRTNKAGIGYLSWTFLKIGSTAFGGFLSPISMLEDILVRRRSLMSHHEMLDGMSLASMLPGPAAANFIAYIGFRIAGAWGAVASMVCSLIPSYLAILLFSIYAPSLLNYSLMQRASTAFTPAMTAVIFVTAWRIGKQYIKSFKNRFGLSIALASIFFLRLFSGSYTTFLIWLWAGFLGYLFHLDEVPVADLARFKFKKRIAFTFAALLGIVTVYLLPLNLEPNGYLNLGIAFSGLSLLLFGSGCVLIPLLQDLVVNSYGWLSQTEFTNAIALSQLTPGSVLISAAAIGYAVKGILGSLLATFCIFCPPAVLMLACSELLDAIKGSQAIQSALTGVRPAVVGLIFAAGWSFSMPMFEVGKPLAFYFGNVLIFAGSIALLTRFKLDASLLIATAGIAGIFVYGYI